MDPIQEGDVYTLLSKIDEYGISIPQDLALTVNQLRTVISKAGSVVPHGMINTKELKIPTYSGNSLGSRRNANARRYEPGVAGWTVDLQYNNTGNQERITLVPPSEHGFAYFRALPGGGSIPEYVVADGGNTLVQYHHDPISLLKGSENAQVQAIDVWKRKLPLWTKTIFRPFKTVTNYPDVLTTGFTPQSLGVFINKSAALDAEAARLRFPTPEIVVDFNTWHAIHTPNEVSHDRYAIEEGVQIDLHRPFDARLVNSLHIEPINDEPYYYGIKLTPTPKNWLLKYYIPQSIEIPTVPYELNHQNLTNWIQSHTELSREPVSRQMRLDF